MAIFRELVKLEPKDVESITLRPNLASTKEKPELSIKPEEDARVPILEAEIEARWRQFRPKYVKELEKQRNLKEQIRETALLCVRVLHQYQNAGLNPDQGREAIQELIIPPYIL